MTASNVNCHRGVLNRAGLGTEFLFIDCIYRDKEQEELSGPGGGEESSLETTA